MLKSNELTNSFIKFLFIFFYSSILLSASNEEFDDDDFFDEIPTVLTVSRLEQPKSESPSAVTVIDREMIKASGARQLADVFRLVPGFIVGNVTGNISAVTYHGLGASYNRQLQVIIDGRSVYIPSFGGVPWTSLPVILEDVERIEITRGPNAASYGANSFLAVINIITSEPSQKTGTHLSVTHSNDHTAVNDAYFSMSKQFEDYDFRISAKTLGDGGFKPFDNEANNDSKEITKFNVSSNFLIQQNSKWSLQFGKNNSILSGGDGTALNIFRDSKTINQYQSLKYEQSSLNSTNNINLFHTEHKLSDSFDTTLGVVNFDRYSERTEIEYTNTVDRSKQLRTVFGGSYRKDTVDSFFLLGPNQKQNINVSRIFAHAEFKFNEDKILNIGAMIENSDIADIEISPRIAFVQHVDDSTSIRFAYSKAFRNPILFETNGFKAFKLHFTPIILTKLKPNPDLKPEEINSYEIGLYSQINASLQTDLKIYEYKLSNQITDFNSSDLDVLGDEIKQFENSLLKTSASGIELSLSYKPSPHFFLKSGLNVIDIDSKIQDVEHSFPDKTFFILSQYDVNKQHSISGAYYYIKNNGWYEFSTHELGNTNKLDLRYAYNFSVNNKTPFTFEIIGQNLLDDYLDYLESNNQERTLFFKLSNNF